MIRNTNGDNFYPGKETTQYDKYKNLLFHFFWKSLWKKSFLGSSEFDNKPQVAVSGPDHTVFTDKSKVVHRQRIYNPLPFQNITTPAKRIGTSQITATHQSSCSKTMDHAVTDGTNRRHPKSVWRARTGWDKKNSHEMKRELSRPEKATDKSAELDLSIISDKDFKLLQYKRRKTNSRQHWGRTTNPSEENQSYTGNR